MSKIYDTIIQTLDELERHYQRDDEHCMADMTIQCECAAFHLRMVAMEEQELLYCFASFPLNIPEGKRPAMCELINAINYDNIIGMLTMDPEDGQLVCRMVSSLDEGAVNSTIVAVALQNAIRILDENHPAILKVLAA